MNPYEKMQHRIVQCTNHTSCPIADCRHIAPHRCNEHCILDESVGCFSVKTKCYCKETVQ